MIETKFEFTHEIGRYLDEMLIANRDLLNQSLSKGGAKVNEAIREAFIRSDDSKYTSMISKKVGKRVIVKRNVSRPFGERFTHKGTIKKDNPSNMYSMIKNFLDEKNNLVVIMGRHPSFVPVKFRDGKRIGRFGPRITGTSKRGTDPEKDIVNILQKLNDGGIYILNKKQSMLLSSMRVVIHNKKTGKAQMIMPI